MKLTKQRIPKIRSKQFYLQVDTELKALNTVLSWFEESLKFVLPEKTRWQCEIALTEGFTNTVRYAHQNLPPKTPIQLELNLLDRLLEIKIWDFGRPFDLKAQVKAELQSQENPLEQEGDRGLLLMEQLTDELDYLRLQDQRNCLVMRKKIP